MNEKMNKWIEAGKKIAEDPDSQFTCPECGDAILVVKDVRNEANPIELERFMSCPKCDATNILRLKRPLVT